MVALFALNIDRVEGLGQAVNDAKEKRAINKSHSADASTREDRERVTADRPP